MTVVEPNYVIRCRFNKNRREKLVKKKMKKKRKSLKLLD